MLNICHCKYLKCHIVPILYPNNNLYNHILVLKKINVEYLAGTDEDVETFLHWWEYGYTGVIFGEQFVNSYKN